MLHLKSTRLPFLYLYFISLSHYFHLLLFGASFEMSDSYFSPLHFPRPQVTHLSAGWEVCAFSRCIKNFASSFCYIPAAFS